MTFEKRRGPGLRARTLLAAAALALASVACPAPAAALPDDLPMNYDAGRGGWIVVTLRLGNGEDALFVIDTGASLTLFDKSMASKLKKRDGVATIRWWGEKDKSSLYYDPKLYAGGVALQTSGITATEDLNRVSALTGRPIKGILGMDCLANYCIQLDFHDGRVRFIDDQPQPAWGKAFPLTNVSPGDDRPCLRENLLGSRWSHSLIDTGDPTDGWLMPGHFDRWRNLAKSPGPGESRMPLGVMGGEFYTDIALRKIAVDSDGVGLRFLARNLVTLDFPRGDVYLRQRTAGPLSNEGASSAVAFLQRMKNEGRLPGWTREDQGQVERVTGVYPFNAGIIDTRRNGDSATYHYAITRPSARAPWRLRRAWKSDRTGRTVEVYVLR